MKIIKSVLTISVVLSMFSCGNQLKEVKSLNTEIDSASYALGLDMAIKVKANFEEADRDLFLQGYKNGIDSTNLLINAKDLNGFLRVFFQKQQQQKTAERAEKSFGENKIAGQEFLASNKSKEGVVETESGLQYIIIKKGEGEKPVTSSKVKVHYHGTNIAGEVFDSSVDKGTPAEFGVTQVIKGWTEGLQLMKAGAKYKFFIPQNLAYGAQQRGAAIKPFSMLIFEVELLEVIN